MDPEDIMLNEMNWTEKDKYIWFYLYVEPKEQHKTETDS